MAGTEDLKFQVIKNYFCCFVCMGKSCLPGCLCTMCVPGVSGGQKQALDPLELELQMFVNCHVDARNQTWVLRKSSQVILTAHPSSSPF